MRGWLVLVLVAAGCAGQAEPPAPRVTLDGHDLEAVLSNATELGSAAPDVCGLAAELPTDNICSLVCDPDAIKARLIDQGAAQGTCYEMLCALPGLSVTVGVCLPPPPP
ncbi:MAG: hypothetical protein JO257_36570 [Deltaproteobacteria bacterium]|nr:hypothetical protein [Deltaproteobacteria bacterium]